MRTKFYYLAIAALVFCWQIIYIVLPLPHGEAYWACEIFTVLLVLVQAAVPLLLAARQDSLAVLNYGQLLVPAACLGVQAGASFVLAALEPPAWTAVILGVVLLTADVLLLLAFAYGRDHAHDVEEENGTGEA